LFSVTGSFAAVATFYTHVTQIEHFEKQVFKD